MPPTRPGSRRCAAARGNVPKPRRSLAARSNTTRPVAPHDRRGFRQAYPRAPTLQARPPVPVWMNGGRRSWSYANACKNSSGTCRGTAKTLSGQEAAPLSPGGTGLMQTDSPPGSKCFRRGNRPPLWRSRGAGDSGGLSRERPLDRQFSLEFCCLKMPGPRAPLLKPVLCRQPGRSTLANKLRKTKKISLTASFPL